MTTTLAVGLSTWPALSVSGCPEASAQQGRGPAQRRSRSHLAVCHVLLLASRRCIGAHSLRLAGIRVPS